jgi:uncharacterized membrane protein affecting hemolysin expression
MIAHLLFVTNTTMTGNTSHYVRRVAPQYKNFRRVATVVLVLVVVVVVVVAAAALKGRRQRQSVTFAT